MAAMMVLMVILLVVGGHHGMGQSHDAKPPAAEALHLQDGDASKTGEDKR